MSDIDPVDLRKSSRPWELQGLVPSGKALDHVSMYGTDLSDEDDAENMYQMFVKQCEPSGGSYYPRSVYDTCRIHQILLRRILQGRINRARWIFG